MSDGIEGKATYKCEKCGAFRHLRGEDFNFDAVSSSERGMGAEIQYSAQIEEECHKCGNEIGIAFDVWEYPIGAINTTDFECVGAVVTESDFDIYHRPPREEPDETVHLVKSLALFRFDAFAEAFVDFWIKSYQQSPRYTAIISAIASILTASLLALSIYSSEKSRAERLDKVQSYTDQFKLLENTEKNLNDLSNFITSKKLEIEATRDLIKNLEEKRSELEPIVEANQEVVDAIFAQQKRELEKGIWVERAISFGLGILASLIATVVWHFVGRLKK